MLRDMTPPTSLSASIYTTADIQLTHDLRNAQKDAHDVDTEPRMREERVEYDSQTLATARDAERVENNDKICASIAWQAYRKDGKDCEDKTGYNLERRRDGYVSKHTDEIKRRNLDQETHTILDGEVVVFQWCEEKC